MKSKGQMRKSKGREKGQTLREEWKGKGAFQASTYYCRKFEVGVTEAH